MHSNMITDTAALVELRASWNGVRQLRGKVQRGLLGSFAQGASAIVLIADIAHNLPFLHAYAVLNDVLLQLSREGHFKSGSIFLGELLKKSRKPLPWSNYKVIKQGADRRNEVAHFGAVVTRADCLRFIDAIESELITWGIVRPE